VMFLGHIGLCYPQSLVPILLGPYRTQEAITQLVTYTVTKVQLIGR
jgi:hypothetical protein